MELHGEIKEKEEEEEEELKREKMDAGVCLKGGFFSRCFLSKFFLGLKESFNCVEETIS